MHRLLRGLTLAVLTLVMAPLSANDEVQLIEVIFAEVEAGTPEYRSRLLLGDAYLRLDDGDDAGDYILFDRGSGEIHSFNHEDETHLHINPPLTDTLEFELEFTKSSTVLEESPPVNNQQPVEHVFTANGNECRKSVNVTGLMPEVLQQLKAYQQTLAAQAMQTVERVPAAMRKPCYMANNYLYPTAYLDVGFPLYVEDYDGSKRRLIGFSQVTKPARLMQFSAGYRLYYATEPSSAGE
jgi:hypothetical protein